jgi:phage gp36-like protein
MYIDIAYIKERVTGRMLVELTDDGTVKTGVSNTDKMNTAIADANAYIDSKLSRFVTVPVTEPANLMTVLQRHMLNLIVYYMYKDRMNLEIPEQIKVDYSNSIIEIDTLGQEFHAQGAAAQTTRANFTVLTNKTATDKTYTKSYLDRY